VEVDWTCKLLAVVAQDEQLNLAKHSLAGTFKTVEEYLIANPEPTANTIDQKHNARWCLCDFFRIGVWTSETQEVCAFVICNCQVFILFPIVDVFLCKFSWCCQGLKQNI
jgi:hypothetical protein